MVSPAMAGIIAKAPYGRWDHPEVRVCWGNDSGASIDTCYNGQIEFPETSVPHLAAKQERVKAAITREFSLERTGISFVGWEPCPADQDVKMSADLVVYFQLNTHQSEIYEGDASLASVCPDKANTISSIRLFPPLSEVSTTAITLDQSLEITALHEFGHAAGLMHEDESSHSAGIFKQTRWDKEKGDVVSSYDQSSVMSYSFFQSTLPSKGLHFTKHRWDLSVRQDPFTVSVNKIEGEHWKKDVSIQLGLSSGDVHALRCVHLYSDEEKIDFCHKRYKPWNVDGL